jgi:alpha-1,2-mannosyltransferase
MQSASVKSAAAAGWLVCAVAVAVYVYGAVRLPYRPDEMSDLHVYLGAVRTMIAGGSLYQFVSFNGDEFNYPPFAGMVFVPLAPWPESALRVFWTLFQCAEAVILAWMILVRSAHPVLKRVPRAAALPALTCLLLVSQPVFWGLFLGQVSLLITVLAVLDALDLTPKRLRGIPTGLAAAIKLTPLLFIPYLWITGRRTTATVALATFMFCTGAAWLALPTDSATYWSSRLSPPGFVNLAQWDNESFRGLLARLHWAGGHSTLILAALTLIVLVLGYGRSQRAYRNGQVLPGAVIIGATTVLVSPISWNHHQTLLVCAATCAISGTSKWANVAWSTAVYLLMTLPFQNVLDRGWPAGHLLTDDAVLCLALLITCVIPFTSWQGTPRGSSSKSSAALAARSSVIGRGRLPSADSEPSERGESAARTVTGDRFCTGDRAQVPRPGGDSPQMDDRVLDSG